MSDARHLAEVFALGGRQCYEEDGRTDPVLVLMGERENGIFLHPHPRLGDDLAQSFAHIVNRIGRIYPWRYFVTITEMWVKHFHYQDALAPELGHGDLERLQQAGDPLVRTCVLTMALNPRQPADSHMVSSIAVEEDPVRWKILEQAGEPEGGMPGMLLHAFSLAEGPPPELPTAPLSLIAHALVVAEVATSAMMLSPDHREN